MRKIAHWLESYTDGETLDILSDLATRHLESIGETGVALASLIRKGKFAAVCDYEIDYSNLTVREARVIRQALALFTKLEFLDIGLDKSANAIAKFVEAEEWCRKTNVLFRQRRDGKVSFRPVIERVLWRARRKIADVLGDVPRFEELGLRYGPGATSLTKKREASWRQKLGAGLSCSEELLPFASRLLEELPHLAELYAISERVDEDGVMWSTVPIVVHEGKVSFAKKNAKTYRAVETQPVLNGMVQLALGDAMGPRLRSVGVDLRDQNRNRRLARFGSLTGLVATLDLTSASDCTAIEPVAELFPIDWFNALNAIRTGLTNVTGFKHLVKLEKLSAMGNGSTFPVESLIFWALSSSVLDEMGCKKHHFLSVYGDDITCPTECFDLICEVLECVGYVPNRAKSFSTGLFRESCGADYFFGTDIRPVYVKATLTPADLFTLANGLIRRGETTMAGWVHDLLHPCLTLYGPDGYGDGHLLPLEGEYKGRPYKRHLGWGGYIFDTYSRVSKRDRRVLRKGDQVLPHYSIYRRGSTPLLPSELKTANPDGYALLVKRGGCANTGSCLTMEEPSLPLPFGDSDIEGVKTKLLDFPGDDGYKRVSIYTLG